MVNLSIQPSVYYEAAQKLITLAAEITTAVTRDLTPRLTATAGMGGNYPAVAGWNTAYRTHSGDVRTAMLDCVAALQHYGNILNISGYNWEAAEYNANASQTKGQPPPPPAPAGSSPLGANSFPETPDPQGDNGAGVVIASEGQSPSSWTGAPNGRADALDTAATGWSTFANSSELTTAPATLQAVHETFDGVQAPEVPDIQEALDALRGGTDQIAAVAAALGSQTRNHYNNLIDARNLLSTTAAGAFPSHPGAQVTAKRDNTSVQVSVAANLSEVDVYNAENIFNTTAQTTALFTDFAATSGATDDFVGPTALSNTPKLNALTELPLIVASGNQNANTALVGELDKIAAWDTPTSALTTVNPSALDQYGPQMKSWAEMSVKYGNEAGVDPRMVLAMVLQEGGPLHSGLENNLYKDLQDPSTYDPRTTDGEQAAYAWDKARLQASQQGISKNGVGNSLGLTNQKEGPFNKVKAAYPDQFQGQQWSDLVGNDDLGIKAAAYNLKMLNDQAASHATVGMKLSQPPDQFLGSGYNAGGMVDRSLSVGEQQPVPDGKGGETIATFKSTEVEHGQSTVSVVKLANQILCGSGAYR